MTHQYEVGKWYKTRGGHDVLIYDVNFKGFNGNLIIGKIKGDSYEELTSWGSNGAYRLNRCEDHRDLMPPLTAEENNMTHQYEVGKWYKTRGGHDVLIYDVNFKGPNGYTISGKIKGDDYETCVRWQSDGAYWPNGIEDLRNLMPPVKREEFWVNVYKGHTCNWPSSQLAEKHASPARIGVFCIVIEGDDFTVEKVMPNVTVTKNAAIREGGKGDAT
jgi:hypothetical protein